MAAAAVVQLSNTSLQPAYYRAGLSDDSAQVASKLLQENHDKHHIFFNADGFHNHIVHHLLAIYALKATPEELQKAYNINEHYQRSMMPRDDKAVQSLSNPQTFIEHLNKEEYYPAYLDFFRKEIEKSSWQDVVQKFVFAGDDVAEAILVRMFGGFLHPIIHLGYGIEFEQPAIIAEGLAQAAVHSDYMGKLFLPAEDAARKRSEKSKSIVELLDAIHDDPQMRAAAKWSDGNKVRDGVIGRAANRAVELTSQFRVSSDELHLRTAEMVNAVCYYSAAAQRAGKKIKWDFYFIHCVNSSIFWSAFLKQNWLSEANKTRLLEWKVRNDLAMYASRSCPDFRFEDIRQYRPRYPSGWDEIEDRAVKVPDDGHSAKLIRALAHGQQICEPYQDRDEFRVKHDDWVQMAHTVIDSVESVVGDESRWIRSAGFDEAWENEPARL